MFELTDLFAAGIGLDLAGAYLLALGLLQSPQRIRRRSTFGGLYPGGLIGDVENRSTARIGLTSLLAGFSLQAVAYVLQLGFGPYPGHSGSRAVIGAVSAAVPALVVIVFERATRHRRFNRLIVCVARERFEGPPGDPDLEMLAKVAEWRGEPRRASEDDDAFASRVFGTPS